MPRNWSGHTLSFRARGNQTDIRRIVHAPGGEGRPKSASASDISRVKRRTGIPNRLVFMQKKIPKAPGIENYDEQSTASTKNPTVLKL